MSNETERTGCVHCGLHNPDECIRIECMHIPDRPKRSARSAQLPAEPECQKCARLQAALDDWLIANGPNGWIEKLRKASEGAPLAAAPEWQPIETAPLTGRKVILFYLNRNAKARTVMARWLSDEQAAETDADGVGLQGGWYECIDNWDDYTEVAIHEGEPTHWCELPAAPTPATPGAGA